MSQHKVTPAEIGQARALLVKLDAAVLAGEPLPAHEAHAAYNTLVHTLNGGTKTGCYADEASVGVQLQQALQAIPGETPMWGQKGNFLVVIDDCPAYVDYCPSFCSHNMGFYAIQAGPFISETGFRSDILCGDPAGIYPGKSVRDVAIEMFKEHLQAHRRKPVYPSKVYTEYAKLPYVTEVLGESVAEIGVGSHVLIKHTKQIGIVMAVKKATRAKPAIYDVATLAGSKPPLRIVESSFSEEDLLPQSAQQLAKLDHPGKYLTMDSIKAIRSIKTAERAL